MIQTIRCTSWDLGVVVSPLRVRKLTPKECFRLMGFTDNDFMSAKLALNNEFYNGKDMSNTQLYKQAGNTIVVKVLEEIFKEMIKEKR